MTDMGEIRPDGIDEKNILKIGKSTIIFEDVVNPEHRDDCGKHCNCGETAEEQPK
jgi:hypothetical protein